MIPKLTQREMETYRKYHIPGQSNLRTRKVDEYRLSNANSWAHELAKVIIGRMIRLHNTAHLTPLLRNHINLLGMLLEELTKTWEKQTGHFIMEAELNKKVNGERKIRDVVQLGEGEPHEIETKKERGERHEKGVNVWRLYD